MQQKMMKAMYKQTSIVKETMPKALTNAFETIGIETPATHKRKKNNIPWKIRTAWKKAAKAGRVPPFEGMFVEQHKFLLVKSESTQLFIYLYITYII